MWNKRHGVLLFPNSASTGVLTPVLSLLLLAKGCTLATMPLAVGFYSAVAVVFEVPSGVAADRWGRKRCFLVSCALAFPMTALLALGDGFEVVLCAMALHGLARAFSSGSLDALVVEEFLLKNGPKSLSVCTGRVSMLTSVGLAAGCLGGGTIYALTGRLWAVLTLEAVVSLLLLLLAAGLEEHDVRQPESHPVADLIGVLRGAGIVRALVLLSVAAAPPLFSVELFYQPRVTELMQTQAAGWVLGVLSAGAYYAAAAGAALGRRVHPSPSLQKLLGVTAFTGAGLLALSAANSVASFIAAYLLFYLIIGWTDVLTSTLMNASVPTQQRATLLSTSSLALQMGGMAASPVLSAAVTFGSISQVWLVTGLAVAAVMLTCLWVGKQRRKEARTGVV